MYVLEYCDDPEKGRLFNGERQFDDNFCDEYEEYLIALDRFMYLLDMFQIIKSCAAYLAELPAGEEFPFWQVNKALINYLNAVYSYKEYINSYDPPLKTITDGYYYNRKWYRFVCDYRNRVIHQSTIIKDRSTKSGDVFINLDEIISIQSEIIQELEKKKATLTQKERLKRYRIK